MSLDASTAPQIELLSTPAQWESLYDNVLARSFPEAELDSRATLMAALDSGHLTALGVAAPGATTPGSPARIGAGVMYLVRDHVALILYLASAPELRGSGIGGALLGQAVARARFTSGVEFVLAEVEHPAHHRASDAFGDPAARLRFYARRGARALAAPYFQPGIGPGAPRVPALLLTTLWVDDSVVAGQDAAGAPTSVAAKNLRDFLAAYVADAEGSMPTDAAFNRLMAAFAAPTIGLVGPDHIDQIPVGTLDATTAHSAALSEPRTRFPNAE